MAVMTKVKAVNGSVQMHAEFINHLFSVPRDRWTGVMDTAARNPMNYWDAWQEMVGTEMNLHAAKHCFPFQRYATDCVLVAVQESRHGHRLSVLTLGAYRVIDVQPSTVDRAGVVIWEE